MSGKFGRRVRARLWVDQNVIQPFLISLVMAVPLALLMLLAYKGMQYTALEQSAKARIRVPSSLKTECVCGRAP